MAAKKFAATERSLIMAEARPRVNLLLGLVVGWIWLRVVVRFDLMVVRFDLMVVAAQGSVRTLS